MVHELLVRQLLPKYTTLLSDKDHSLLVPQCAVKIAALVMHHNPAFAVVCLSPSISPPPLVMHHNPAVAVGFLFASPCLSSPTS